MDQPLLPVKTKTTYTTDYIKILEYTKNKNGHPTTLTTTKGLKYKFLNLVYCNNLNELRKLLSKSGTHKIVYDNDNFIHKIDDFPFPPLKDKLFNELKIISFTKGLIFDDKVEITDFENVRKFYKLHDAYKIMYEGPEIVVIIRDIISVEIPLIY